MHQARLRRSSAEVGEAVVGSPQSVADSMAVVRERSDCTPHLAAVVPAGPFDLDRMALAVQSVLPWLGASSHRKILGASFALVEAS